MRGLAAVGRDLAPQPLHPKNRPRNRIKYGGNEESGGKSCCAGRKKKIGEREMERRGEPGGGEVGVGRAWGGKGRCGSDL
jgi:hypothetical protein